MEALGVRLKRKSLEEHEGRRMCPDRVNAMITSLVRTWKLYRVRLRRKSLEGFGGPGMSTHRDK